MLIMIRREILCVHHLHTYRQAKPANNKPAPAANESKDAPAAATNGKRKQPTETADAPAKQGSTASNGSAEKKSKPEPEDQKSVEDATASSDSVVTAAVKRVLEVMELHDV